ncbi:class Ib ribonucleoside-diphosphate reductase assembly flavoprotein NrdI [Candidatus Mycoplasma mahonii]|uniref:class Ib ribonucleoside-diphosphate reductase assembly flavoprotein NrdI n=1 Tax=Candidatus Mycoplasma mahonii TaxID=3004105 RepID=UPI0026ED3DEB|nr:class Ib ribonucleoside-diphosphate reductase assembly flavoprotein NrdI [Candidatus Mycoplasma mahonii]WKX02627.1 class Ib ribonucleoside-diphosphate reductase assembly flavoprotein NrdI [Candidatus Mycoplasma mahonii]
MLNVKSTRNNIINDILLVYFSSATGNTHRFIEKLGFSSVRLPVSLHDTVTVNKDYVIIVPTYSGGGDIVKGAIPKQVVTFLNNKNNRSYCQGVIATGNTNFGETYGLAGSILSKKLNIPFLYKLELSGVNKNVTDVQKLLIKFWKINKQQKNDLIRKGEKC